MTIVSSRFDGINGGVPYKAPCAAATTANITLSGEQTIDGVSVVDGDRVLVKEQSSSVENGIWNASTGNWTRSKDFDGNRDVVVGTQVYVLGGTVNGGVIFSVASVGEIGTNALTFESALAYYLNRANHTGSAGVVGDGEVTTAKLANNAVTLAKMATQSNATILANISGGAAVPTAATLTAIIDAIFGSDQGAVMYRGASNWGRLSAGTAGYFLKTGGAGNDPSWADAATSVLPSQTGNSGKLLTTNGSASSWSGDSSVRARASITNGTTSPNTVGTGAVNVASCTQSSGTYTITFTNALASANYQVMVTKTAPGANPDGRVDTIVKSTTGFTVEWVRSGTGGNQTVAGFDFVVYGGF